MFTRREMLTGVVAGTVLTSIQNVKAEEPVKSSTSKEPFSYCLNTATIRGQDVGIVREAEIAAAAGYKGFEPWMGGIEKYVKDGGLLTDLRKKIADLGLTVESAIGFANWIVDDEEGRKKGLEQAKRDMDLLAQIGGKRIAAPPAGATNAPLTDLTKIGERYRALCILGEQMGVIPQLEVWGFSKTLSRLAETIFVAVEASHPVACVLPDIYHLHKGGSAFDSLKLIGGQGVHVFHVNDYPAMPTRDKINDADRVYPGDGVAPNAQIFQSLYKNGFRGMLSLELFNRDYWKQDPLVVAKTGLQKTRDVVQKAMEGAV
ncbi:MAG: sugar phosphate isomerase/epimerase [Planctomycetaceae bacterium]|nr:sugar phosphate isomerase/epimerase [Planctomycetaceae bacterium]